MAGEWIKMRTSLWDDGRVRAIARVTLVSRSTVTGALYRLWALADEHTTDGHLVGYDGAALDEEVEIPGFASALQRPEIGWLISTPTGLQIPRFEDHNGGSAKSRDQAAKRQKKHRNASVTVTALPREEKRREEKKRDPEDTPPPPKSGGVIRMVPVSEVLKSHAEGARAESAAAGFLEIRAIWQAYPSHRRVSWRKSQLAITEALSILSCRGETNPAAWLQARVEAYAASPAGKPGGFTKDAPNWFSEGKYDDPPEAWERTDGDAAPSAEDTAAMLDRVMGAKS